MGVEIDQKPRAFSVKWGVWVDKREWYAGNYQDRPLSLAFCPGPINCLQCHGLTSVTRLVGRESESLAEKYWQNYAMIKFQCHDQGATET